jgi:hypothetical protein
MTRYQRLTPEQKARKAAREKAYRARPEIKARNNALRRVRAKSPKYREKSRAKNRRWSISGVLRGARKRARLQGLAIEIERPTRPPPPNCEICNQNKTGRRLHFDHCHRTGRFRGWLCHHCNTGLGAARDNPEILRRMIDYLEPF